MKKVHVRFTTLIVTVIHFFAFTATAGDLFPGACKPLDIMFNTAYGVSGAKLAVLSEPRPLAKNGGLAVNSIATRVRADIRNLRRAQRINEDLPDITADKLSLIITTAALSTGIDFGILSGIVRKESEYCRARHNRAGGDSGCSQFTTPALSELKNQFGITKDKPSPGVPAVLRSFVSEFYKNAPQREENFYRWLSSDTNTMRVQLRTGDDQDIDILAGALFLKLNLAIENGNYNKALQLYNGSKRRAAYAREAMALGVKVNFDPLQGCADDREFTNEVIGISCEVSGDADCFLDESLADDFGIRLNQT